MMLDCLKGSSNGCTLLHAMVLGNDQHAKQCQAMPSIASSIATIYKILVGV